MRTKDEYPYKECKLCKDLGDCPYREVLQDGMGTVMPASDCPKPIDVMRETLKKKKHGRSNSL